MKSQDDESIKLISAFLQEVKIT